VFKSSSGSGQRELLVNDAGGWAVVKASGDRSIISQANSAPHCPADGDMITYEANMRPTPLDHREKLMETRGEPTVIKLVCSTHSTK
jgi:hypothetical protein